MGSARPQQADRNRQPRGAIEWSAKAATTGAQKETKPLQIPFSFGLYWRRVIWAGGDRFAGAVRAKAQGGGPFCARG